MTLTKEQNAERMRRLRAARAALEGAQAGAGKVGAQAENPKGAQTRDVHPWEDPSLDWETRMRAGKKEADRVGHPIVVSNAKGIVMLPEVQTSYGPPQLSVYTPPYVRRR